MKRLELIALVLLLCLSGQCFASDIVLVGWVDSEADPMLDIEGEVISIDEASRVFSDHPPKWPKGTVSLRVVFEKGMRIQSLVDARMIFRFMGFRSVRFLVASGEPGRYLELDWLDEAVAADARHPDR